MCSLGDGGCMPHDVMPIGSDLSNEVETFPDIPPGEPKSLLSSMKDAGRSLVSSIKRAGTKSVLAVVAAGAALGAAQQSSAQNVTVTYMGTVSSGSDVSGIFGAPGTDLTGDAYTLTFTFNPSVGTVTTGSTSSQIYSSATPGATAVLQIGAGSWNFGGYPIARGNSEQKVTLPPAWDSEVYSGVSDTYVSGGGTGGGDSVSIGIISASGTPPITMNPNWAGSLSRSAQVEVNSEAGTFTIAYTVAGTPEHQASGYLYVSSVVLNGVPGTAALKSLGAASNISCGCQLPSNQSAPAGDSSKSINQTADPITIGNGNMYEDVKDYSTVGPNPLTFNRHYNSLAVQPGFTSYATSLGSNWRTNYDRYLQISPATGTATTVLAERADGQVLTFTNSGSGWVADSDVDYTLTQSGTNWTLTDPNDTVESYTSSGAKGTLNTIQARNGYTQNLTYSSGLLSNVTDSYSRSLNFTYSGTLLQSVTTPDTLTLAYGFTGSNLTSVTYNGSTNQTYVYGDASFPNALTSIVDENGNTTASWTYDVLGNAATSQRGSGADMTTMTYQSSGNVQVTNAYGVVDTYQFSPIKGVRKIIEIDRASTSTTAAAHRYFTYDTPGYLATATDWNGNETVYTNNTHGQPTAIVEASGSTVARTTTISYDPTFVHLPHQIVTSGLTRTFAYDTSGNPLTQTDLDTTTNTVPYSTNGQTRVTTYTWSGTGQETSIQLPRTDVTAKTTFTYGADDALTDIYDPLGHHTQITSHTGGGLPTTIVDPNGVTTTLTYDARLNLHTSTLHAAAGNLVTTWTYDPANELSSFEKPDGSTLTYGYDTAHRRTSTTDSLGNSINLTLNALGNTTLTQVKNPGGTVTATHSGTFDALGRLIDDIGAASQTTVLTYDNNSNLLRSTPPSPEGVTIRTYDALNRLKSIAVPSPSGTTNITYDAHDKPLTVADPGGHTTTNTYNGFGDATQIVSPDTGTSVFTYDPDRNLTQKVLAGSLTANMTYDADDRVLTTSYPSDSTLNVSRTYDQTTGHGDGIGHLTSETDQAGSLALTYDERANITYESRVVTGAGTLNTTTVYDGASRVAGIGYPSGTLVAYGRDAAGQVTSVTAEPPGAGSPSNVATGITYEPFGPVTGLTYGNGVTGTYGYDADYRNTTRVDSGTGSVQNLTYAYYANSSPNTITDSLNAANSQTLTYNSNDSLASAVSGTGGYGSWSWTWDSTGNVQHQVINGTTTNFSLTSGTNHLSQWANGTTVVATHTAAGNLNTTKISGVTQETLNYNQANELSSVSTTSAAATYEFGLDGRRIEKAPPGVYPIIYQYGQAAKELLSENDLHGGQTADYIYLNGQPIGEINPTSSTLYYTHTDRLGTPQKLTDSSQSTVWSATYQPFGSTQTLVSSLGTQNLRLPGQSFDAETGMNHNGFRDYAAGLTRYVESDPIGLNGGISTYQYVKGNPAKFVDPQGKNASDGSSGSWGGLSYSTQTAILNNPLLRFIGDNPQVGSDIFYGGAALATCGAAADVAAVEEGSVFGTRYMDNSPWLNSADSLRIGWSKLDDEYTFRIGGKLIESIKPDDPHITLWPPKYWFGVPKP
jgi:RHS repeat-associated protein